MRKHIDSPKALLVAFLATGLSAACMNNPVAGTSEPDAGSATTPSVPDAAPVPDTVAATPDSLPVKLDAAVAICGNGKLDPGEGCDDGNAQDFDGCASNCTLEPGALCPQPGLACSFAPTCGDGQVQVELGEQCDLGANNVGSYAGCSPDCTLGPYCGDGRVLQGFEKCDDGINDGRYGGCAPNCSYGPRCGDGIVQADHEACDDGNLMSADGCSSTCQCESSSCSPPASVCGDGRLDVALGETCDDGNTLNDDGCSDTCQVEPCWAACGCNSSKPCLPTMMCGNGKLEGNEACDDGNTTPGDGCSGICQVEPGWTCAAPGRHCSSVCGDGILTSNEQCDDGNAQSGDGCSNACKIEPNY